MYIGDKGNTNSANEMRLFWIASANGVSTLIFVAAASSSNLFFFTISCSFMAYVSDSL